VLTPDQIITMLGLQPHPEGGHFAETFRDRRRLPDGSGRSVSTAIYFLIQAGEVSHWHRIDAAELWHWYAGAPLALEVTADADRGDGAAGGTAGGVQRWRLGPDLLAGERPQRVVSAGVWQSARSLGAWTLAGCTVAPGFEFSSFELAPVGWRPGGYLDGLARRMPLES